MPPSSQLRYSIINKLFKNVPFFGPTVNGHEWRRLFLRVCYFLLAFSGGHSLEVIQWIPYDNLFIIGYFERK